MDHTTSELHNRLATIFRFLAQAMQYPDKKTVSDASLSFLDTLLEQLGWSDAQHELKTCLAADPDPIESLQIEHTRLFINAVPTTVAPPYGSVYMPGEGLLMGRSSEQALTFYRQRGFELADKGQIPDHIVTELEFLSVLAESRNSEDEKVFLQNFFRPWFEIFHHRVIEGADHPFYGILVRLIDFFTTEEEDGTQSDATKISAIRHTGRSLYPTGENCSGTTE